MSQKFLNNSGNLEISLKVTFFNPHPKSHRNLCKMSLMDDCSRGTVVKVYEVKSGVLVTVTNMVMETMSKSRLRRNQFSMLIFAHIFSSSKEVRARTQAGIWSKSWCRSHGGMLLIWITMISMPSYKTRTNPPPIKHNEMGPTLVTN